MATSRGRKSVTKKKEVAASPDKEVIEPKVEAKPKVEPKKAVIKKAAPAPEPVQEELPPSPPAPEPEPVVEPVVEEVKQVAAVKVVEPEPRVVGIGSLVMMPSGKRGTVISVNRKGYFEVRSERNPRKTYLYESSQLSLV
jgi:type IV secretory pathway VirB10-like protein